MATIRLCLPKEQHGYDPIEILRNADQRDRIRFFEEESAKFRAEMAERRLAGREPRS